MEGSDLCTIVDNIIMDNLGDGLQLSYPGLAGSPNNLIKNNTFDNNGEYGIYIGSDDSADNLIEKNIREIIGFK